MKEHNRDKRILLILQLSVIVLFAATGFSLCFSRILGTDEAFTMQLIREHNFAGIIRGTAADVHPPLYYFLAKTAWLLFGGSLFVQKILVFLPFLILMVFAVLKMRKYFGGRAVLLFLLFLASFPQTFEYTGQIRMYSWGMLFVTLCGFYAYRAYVETSWKNWIILWLCTIAAAYVNYFALVPAALIYAFLFVFLLVGKRQELKKWLVMAVLMILSYLPWLIVLLGQMKEVASDNIFPDIAIVTGKECLEWLFAADIPHAVAVYVVLFLLAALFLMGNWIKRKNPKEIAALLALLLPILTALTGIILSVTIRPMFYARYLFPSVGVLVLGFAVAMRWLRGGAYICLCLFFLAMGGLQYKSAWQAEYHSTKIAETEAFFQENLTEDDIILYNYTNSGFIYEFYWPEEQLVYLEDMDYAGKYGDLWYLETYNFPTIMPEVLENNNLEMEYIGGYGIEHNKFRLYKISRRQMLP